MTELQVRRLDQNLVFPQQFVGHVRKIGQNGLSPLPGVGKNAPDRCSRVSIVACCRLLAKSRFLYARRPGRKAQPRNSGRSRKCASASGLASADVFLTSRPWITSRTASSVILPETVRGR